MLEVVDNIEDDDFIEDGEIRDIFDALSVEEGIELDDIAIIHDFPNYVVTKSADVYYLRGKSQKLAKVKPTKRSHPTVNLVGPDGNRRGKLLSRIVATAFISDPPSPSHRVFHRDGNTENNHIDNLYWSSLSPAKESKMIANGSKTLSHAILDEEEVLSIYNELLKGKTLRAIGDNYGVTPQTIQMIKDGLTWKHIITRKMLFHLRGVVARDKVSIKQYMLLRSEGDDVFKIPSDAYCEDFNFSPDRSIYVTDNGFLFELSEVNHSDKKKFGIDNSYVLITPINAKKTVTVCNLPYAISILVAITFLGHPKDGQYLNYKDGNMNNLSKSNLEWVEYRVGRNHGMGRALDAEKVKHIKTLLNENAPVRDISEMYNVSRSAIYKIKKEESWAWVN